jgi:hypothetical protein
MSPSLPCSGFFTLSYEIMIFNSSLAVFLILFDLLPFSNLYLISLLSLYLRREVFFFLLSVSSEDISATAAIQLQAKDKC